LDKINATAGSYALLSSRPPREFKVATKLREAGAVTLGLANLSEWANIRSETETAGWSPRGGYTKGIYYPGMNAQGSSSGPAVAAGLGLAFASLGSEV
jgi:amidase